jgi:Acetyltransferase (GNAT) domain
MLSLPESIGLERNISHSSSSTPVQSASREESFFRPHVTPALESSLSQAPGELTLTWVRQQDQLNEIFAHRARVWAYDESNRVSPLGLGGPFSAASSVSSSAASQDIFDEYCEHIMVKNPSTGQVLASCRLLTPTQSKRVGGLELENDFDLTRIRAWRTKVLELGRVVFYPLLTAATQARIIRLLREQILGFVQSNQLLMVLSAVHEPMRLESQAPWTATLDAPTLMSSTRREWSYIRTHHLSPIEFQLRARYPLAAIKEQSEGLGESSSAAKNNQTDPSHEGTQSPFDLEGKSSPPLLKPLGVYLRMGAKVMGQPSWSREQGAVHWALMMRAQDLRSPMSLTTSRR